ncbi:MAG: 16S rRNA (guanine(527)-N(7))-methyltransferase RsmG [Spirochaetota bacterium]|nr:MAG: 16S rRNA (guanine(527)-N(7))-methyltransferase RsmG [Spirochaetota bacterium]
MYISPAQKNLLQYGLERLGIEYSAKTLELFTMFIKELLLWNRKTNLVGTQDADQIIKRHILDSVSVYHLLKSENGSILDIGTGAGFPSVPLKIAAGHLHITACERRSKRAAFLRNVSALLGFTDYRILECDVRELRDKFDIILARGVGELKALVSLTRNVTKERSMIIAFKGKITEIEKEMKRLKENSSDQNGMNLDIQSVKVPYLDKEERNIVIITTK